MTVTTCLYTGELDSLLFKKSVSYWSDEYVLYITIKIGDKVIKPVYWLPLVTFNNTQNQGWYVSIINRWCLYICIGWKKYLIDFLMIDPIISNWNIFFCFCLSEGRLIYWQKIALICSMQWWVNNYRIYLKALQYFVNKMLVIKKVQCIDI